MEWIVILGILLLVGVPVAVIALINTAISHRKDIRDLQRQVHRLQDEVAGLKPTGEQPASMAPPAVAVPTPKPEPVAVPAVAPITAPAVVAPTPSSPSAPESEETVHATLERQFGGRAFVWLGGVALALAGFFLVKYSIEMGLITETVRIILGLAFGTALILASVGVRALKNLADGTRIAQALAGAGIADLYGSLFAATTLYHLVPPWVGFAAMAGVTAVALVMSLRYGSPIAVLGLVGGYATPALIHGEPNTPLLFGYLYMVCACLTAVARGRGWWWLSAPTLIVAYGWVVGWLFFGYTPSDAFWIALFLVATGVTAVASDKSGTDADTPRLLVRNLAPAGALLLMGALTYTTQFGTFEWAMFAVLSLWAMLLARLDGHAFRLVPWLAMAANIVMLANWTNPEPVRVAIVIGGFAALFAAGSQILMVRSDRPVSWGLISAGAALGYFLLAFVKLDSALFAAVGKQHAEYVWAAIALALALYFAVSVAVIYAFGKDGRVRQILLAVYTAAATAFVSIALAILLDAQYLPLAAAAEVFVLSWLARGLAIATLRPIAMVLTAIFVLLILPFVGPGLLAADNEALQPALMHTLLRFLAPAVLLALAAINWRKEDDDAFGCVLEVFAALLVAVTLPRLTVVAFAGHAPQFNLLVASALTNALLLWAAVVAWIGRAGKRAALSGTAVALGILTGLHVVSMHFVAANPLFGHQWVGDIPFANGILAAYVAPAVLYAALAKRLPWPPAAIAANVAAYGLAVASVILLVRQLFHGAYLDSAGASNAEIYGYSVAGLVAGIVLLLMAVARRDGAMRVASLVVMMLTVAKVFLYDASELTGLWRVVSFLGLGFCLLGLSWFYSRFVFRSKPKN